MLSPLPDTSVQSGAWAVIYCSSSATFLFGKRSLAVNKGGAWNFFGGRVDAGETPRAALTRELLEEAGLLIEAHDLLEVACIVGMKNSLGSDTQSVRYLHYFLYCLDRTFVPRLNFEHSDFRWCARDKLPRRFNRPTAMAINAGILEQALAILAAKA